MSGSGGGGGISTPFDNCELLVIDTQLSSPKPNIVSKIKVNDILSITIQRTGETTVVVALHGKDVAGGLASPETGRLRACIESGTQYVAKVTFVNDGQVRIRVSAAGIA